MGTWLQNFALVFCWLVGCFAAVSPLEKSPNFLFKWRSASTCYSLLLIAITVADSCILMLILPRISPLLENGAYTLVTVICGFSGRALVLLFRVLTVLSGKQVIILIQDLKALQDFCPENGRCKSLQTDRLWKVVTLATLIVLILKVHYFTLFKLNCLTSSSSSNFVSSRPKRRKCSHEST